jgi:hypothetical protein
MSKRQVYIAISCLVTFVAISHYSCMKDKGRIPREIATQSFCDSLNVKYSTHIQSMMVTQCATTGCHDGSGSAPLDLNNYADLKTFYDFGTLKSRVIDLKDMPPAGPLPDSLIQKLKCWMDAGAQNN